jgi:hypothetical protein
MISIDRSHSTMDLAEMHFPQNPYGPSSTPCIKRAQFVTTASSLRSTVGTSPYSAHPSVFTSRFQNIHVDERLGQM